MKMDSSIASSYSGGHGLDDTQAVLVSISERVQDAGRLAAEHKEQLDE